MTHADADPRTQIQQFTSALSSLPNPTETLWSFPDPAGKPGIYVVLRFHRAQDQSPQDQSQNPWLLSWDYDDDFKDPRDVEWKPLFDAPAPIQLAATAMFPGILKRQGA